MCWLTSFMWQIGAIICTYHLINGVYGGWDCLCGSLGDLCVGYPSLCGR